ncbi:glycosyltransferase [Capnocytophaga haemolytica]|uniref:Glycosyltransferase n=1 Tax=Capnocytophaga haemolytica TaxID=45243 RepID=A0ABM5XBY1_9FLAO|nr:glycosyltransferase [Capnocytophaga haemolytica]
MKKRCVETVRSVRKETEKFKRGEVGFLMKKGCKMGGVSL